MSSQALALAPKTPLNHVREPESVRAEKALHNAPYLPLRNVTCRIADGSLELHGRLPSYYLKQVAQTVVISATRVLPISNRIEVVGPKADIW
jgi:hypothetical protein